MTEHLSFDATPDPELRTALRAALDAGDDAAFTARVQGALLARPVWWEVLGGQWNRPTLAVAVALIALAGLWLGTQPGTGNGPFDETIAAATPGTVAALLAADRPPSMDIVLAASQPH